jgi:magnesium transporter
VILDCAIYEEGRRRDGSVDLHHVYRACRQGGKFAWIGMYEPTEDRSS